MIYNEFGRLKVFQEPQINTICDKIYSEVVNVFGSACSMKVCGSVGRIFHGILSDNYIPKDIDLVCTNYFVYRMLLNRLPKLFPNYEFRIDNIRMILFTEHIAIEIWKPSRKSPAHLYQNKIAYTL